LIAGAMVAGAAGTAEAEPDTGCEADAAAGPAAVAPAKAPCEAGTM
jgi:hypothetical protein